MKEKPQENKDPPLEDPNHVTEIFGDGLAPAAISGGCAHLTFAASEYSRPSERISCPPLSER